MENNKLPNSAVDSTKAISYQLLVALDIAYSLDQDQKLWIEKYGDVTISHDSQIEVKHLAKPLSDNNIAFWNTIKNWLDKRFEHHYYKSLVLSTTQSIGLKSIFNQWESSNVEKRYSDLYELWISAEKRFKQKQVEKPHHKPSEVLAIQREIFNEKNAELKEIIPKIVIVSDAPNYEKKWSEMVRKYARGIPSENQQLFIQALIGFLISAQVQDGWEITNSQFTEEVRKINSLYQNGQHIFPKIKKSADLDHTKYVDKLFIKKINEISHHEVLTEAINDYVYANAIIWKELKGLQKSYEYYLEYQNQLKRKHNSKYREKCAELKLNADHDIVISSQCFYDHLMGDDPQLLCPYTNTPIDFRNGVYHILADDDNDNIHWKLRR
ncbi:MULTISPECIES: hypothetical protein [unclassified Gilliamella]|uniref:hypothetical protein n=1 Tax=unclassified Gilliamella TaxID=2685620 RepID=UPI0013094F88|nr:MULTISPECIES: hypothetical protein [unclassified Gilliamella]MWP49656.1 hypothetical protein [Gilliamella sp. Lep-s35]MWP68906.1 hypothetical protein [Gilliamella sp. Lep-s5]MWP77551.1 hypothetical protein [Gilliamella sp. Lep-s21]